MHIPRERGGHPTEQRLGTKYTIFPANAGGQPTVACPGAGMRTFPLRKQGCPILADIGNLSIRLPPALAGMFRRAPNSNNLLRFEFPVRGVASQKQMPLSTYHAFSLLLQSWLKRKEEGCPVGARLALHWQGLSIGNKYTNSPRIDGVEPKTKTASTEELPCASGGSKVVCICHSNPCICGEKSTKAR